MNERPLTIDFGELSISDVGQVGGKKASLRQLYRALRRRDTVRIIEKGDVH